MYSDILVNLLRIFNTKSTISQKLNMAKIGKLFSHRFQNIAHHFGQEKIGHFCSVYLVKIGDFKYFEYKINHILQTKNCKNQKTVYSFVSDHCTSFFFLLFFEGGEGSAICMSLTKKNPYT